MGDSRQDVAAFRQFNRRFTQQAGVLADQYLGQARPLGAARVLFEIGSGVSLRELRTRLSLDPGYLSRIIRSLEDEGLIRVGAHPGDGRLRVAGLTPAGEAELAEQDRRANGAAEGLLGTLAEGQRRELMAALGTAQRLLRLAAVSVRVADPASADVRGCLAAYVAELRERFPEGFDEADLVQAQEMQGDAGVFLVAYEDGCPIGGGALRALEPGTGEIRHLWVAAGARGLGVGRRLLTGLEREAASRGLGVVRLGTHRVLTEAFQLYRGSGYTEIPRYGHDSHADFWFEKRVPVDTSTGDGQAGRAIPLSAAARRMSSSAIREILKITQRPDVISFAGGLPAPELFPVAEVRAATDRVLTDHGAAALQYSTTEGHLPLREWIARQSGLTPDHVQIVSGSQQGLDLLGRVLIDPGDVVLVEQPTYLGALQAFASYRPRFVEVATDDDGIVPEALDEQLKSLGTRSLLYTVPTFQNPTGRTLPLRRRRQLLEITWRHGVTVIEDGPYNALRFRGESVPTLFELALDEAADPDRTNVVMLGTFSKVLTPGLRDAWVQGPRHVIDRLVYAKQAADLHSPTLNQLIITELLPDVLPRQIKVISDAYGRRASVMLESIRQLFPPGVTCTAPEGGMFCWLTLPTGPDRPVDTTTMLEEAVEHKVSYVPGQPFFATGDGRNTLRLSFATSTEDQIRAGISALAGVVKRAYLEK
ncbi:MAG: aminotransferase class I/II-fold pyridoxal phosphate-dependent enzyme [Trebonia sp.]|jgi:2-aminoadipate transaminase